MIIKYEQAFCQAILLNEDIIQNNLISAICSLVLEPKTDYSYEYSDPLKLLTSYCVITAIG
jgi:hypothetical protein